MHFHLLAVQKVRERYTPTPPLCTRSRFWSVWNEVDKSMRHCESNTASLRGTVVSLFKTRVLKQIRVYGPTLFKTHVFMFLYSSDIFLSVLVHSIKAQASFEPLFFFKWHMCLKKWYYGSCFWSVWNEDDKVVRHWVMHTSLFSVNSKNKFKSGE